jgi:hypothetical protein
MRHHDLDGVFFFRFGFDPEMISASASGTSDCTGENTFMIRLPALGQFGQKFAKNAKALELIGGESNATMAERVGLPPRSPTTSGNLGISIRRFGIVCTNVVT